jgi:hypothetical protein
MFGYCRCKFIVAKLLQIHINYIIRSYSVLYFEQAVQLRIINCLTENDRFLLCYRNFMSLLYNEPFSTKKKLLDLHMNQN